MGLVAGAYGELSSVLRDTTSLIRFRLAGEHPQLLDIDHETYKSIFLQQARRNLWLAPHRGWTKLVLGRCQDLVQHPNHPRPTATGATDEDDEEAQTALQGAPCLGFSC